MLYSQLKQSIFHVRKTVQILRDTVPKVGQITVGNEYESRLAAAVSFWYEMILKICACTLYMHDN